MSATAKLQPASARNGAALPKPAPSRSRGPRAVIGSRAVPRKGPKRALTQTPETTSFHGAENPIPSDPVALFATGPLRDFRSNVKKQLSLDAAAAKSGGITRDHIADRMSTLTGRDISVFMVDNWIAETKKTKNIPLGLVNAWSEATGARNALQYVTTNDPTLARRLRLGEIEEERARLDRERAEILGVA